MRFDRNNVLALACGITLGQLITIALAPGFDAFAFMGVPAPLALPLSLVLMVMVLSAIPPIMRRFCAEDEKRI